ncbi:P-type conjugative transfer protein TrbJ [Parvularcula flava]|uniref:Conjugal transfer protein TrbJ n=1 Tax=Aquisalinus luteolus TaxID=1566827 RepID=A0A8J3A0Y0_9PROT|nr:P-type conjugative transfer protein TrbJ [Aquisalinus luteolus]NHK27116.1 P-type conjugative transfer protein TrbJ [Aquisalinus luteolus]GGH94422.1 conjugal transfer protein TrbJ [Aquisalinus luteolus]
MRRLLASLALAALPICTLSAPPAQAQLFGGGIVYDPANHAENILQAVRALQQIDQQLRQLGHEIEMLENMARDLERLPDSVAGEILVRLERMEDLMGRAEGIGYRVEEIARAYDAAYPEDYGETPPRGAVLVAEARARWRQSRLAYRDSLEVTAGIVSSAGAEADTLDGLIAGSQSAVGNLQAAQAGNQIAALQAAQLMQMEAMMAARYRAEALERARELAEAERGRARTRAFLGR